MLKLPKTPTITIDTIQDEIIDNEGWSPVFEQPTLPTLPGYQFIRKLGSGAFATVYLATHNGEQVAVKCVETSDAHSLKFLIQESKIYSILSQGYNESIPKFIDFLSTPSLSCIVLEYIQGKELFDIIIKEHVKYGDQVVGIPENNAKTIIYNVLRGVEFMHAKDIAHCDLKLENILVVENYKVKILDFGLAHLTSQHQDEHQKGSEPYLSPETIMRTGKDSCKADIWALGVVSFALLTSRMPFDGNPEQLRQGGHQEVQRTRTMLRRIASGQWSWSDTERLAISEDARKFVEDCLVRSSDKRPTSLELLSSPWFNDMKKEKSNPVDVASQLLESGEEAMTEKEKKSWTSRTLLSIQQKLKNL